MKARAAPEIPPSAWKPLLFGMLGVVVIGVLLLGSAGTTSWAQGWTFLCLWAVAAAMPTAALIRDNPGLLARQARGLSQGRRYERVLQVVHVLFVLAIPVLAGLEVQRFEATALPSALVYPGTLLLLLGAVARSWAMLENPHYEAGMRIQRDIGHKVIYNGPYRVVRHPGYLFTIIQAAGAPLVLCSTWAWAPVIGIAGVMVVRAVLEDRTLRDELKGYIAYTRQVPIIMLPGVW